MIQQMVPACLGRVCLGPRARTEDTEELRALPMQWVIEFDMSLPNIEAGSFKCSAGLGVPMCSFDLARS